jgi:hypothetical protein
MPIAMNPRTNTLTMLQMDGHLTREEFERGLKMAMSACHTIYDLQRAALIDKYSYGDTTDTTNTTNTHINTKDNANES